MKEILERLNYLIVAFPLKIKEFSEQEFSEHPEEKWSRKEILGHLCDSATNNYHRFIRIQFEKQPFFLVSYDQNNWVLIHGYQTIPTDEIVDFWITINQQIIRVISNIPEGKLLYLCDSGDNEYITLSELIQDYVRHMDHHLGQIFGASSI